MALKLYNKKRDFKQTKEPEGKVLKKKPVKKKQLLFVVQQHSASHLHYDFRLEMEGVLKSWAVPKGPSMNPDDKRLAMMVEDHPYDYKDFEGTIPEGNYGAGNVIVWDNGTYHSIETDDPKEGEKILLDGIEKGQVKFILEGEKLKGEFALIKLKRGTGNQWLLIKKKDEFATKSDILKKNKSVISGDTLELRKSKATVKAEALKKKPEKVAKDQLPKKAKLNRLKPMLAELHETAFDSNEWLFEVKYDGYRACALLDGKGDVDLYSRNLLPLGSTYKAIASSLKKIKIPTLIDGEIVVESKKGKSDFQLMQNYQKNGEGNLKYYVFDILNLDGYDTTGLPLVERKELLKSLLNKFPSENIIYSEHVFDKGIRSFEKARKAQLEGIIAKKKDSIYRSGIRSRDWLKIKISNEQEVVVAGITEPKGGRKFFGSLLLGVFEDGVFTYVGNCGTGFNFATLKDLYEKFKPYFTDQQPFGNKIKVPASVQWIKPAIVCQVKFSEWTKDRIMRHPVFLGLRNDKKPKEVVREIPSEKKTKQMTVKAKSTGKIKASKSEKEGAEQLKVGNKTLQITNRNKIYWPVEKYTKGDLIDYYSEIADWILPYLKDRPQSMNRFPNGINGASFYQKDVDVDKIPQWLKTEKVYSESTKSNIEYLVCNDKATLLYMANLGCIEINPWNSRISKPENPDWLVIDLDPEDISFKEVVRTANMVRKVFEELEIESYCKTSGATGMHIYIPLNAKYDYDIVKTFAELIAQTVQSRLPETTSIIRSPAKRKKKVYVDFLQNRRGQTLAAPYSVRPKPGATVSTPLLWKEVNEKIDPSMFTIKNILKRIEKTGDLWKPVIGKGIDIKKALTKLQEKNL